VVSRPQPDSAPSETAQRARESAPIEVVVAAMWRVRAGRCEVLLTRRPADVHLPGAWELPGGKVPAGERHEDAIVRELVEEIGVQAVALRPIATTEHAYPERSVRLHAFLGRLPDGAEVRDRAVVEHRWVPVDELAEVALPEANRPLTKAIIDALQAPPVGPSA
jgi:mutator protein MutT